MCLSALGFHPSIDPAMHPFLDLLDLLQLHLTFQLPLLQIAVTEDLTGSEPGCSKFNATSTMGADPEQSLPIWQAHSQAGKGSHQKRQCHSLCLSLGDSRATDFYNFHISVSLTAFDVYSLSSLLIKANNLNNFSS